MIKIWKVNKYTEKKDFSEIKTYDHLETIIAMRLSKYIIVEDIYGKKHNIKTLSQLKKIKNILPADEIRKNMQLGKKWSQSVTKKVKKSEKPKVGTFTKNAEYIVNELMKLSEGDVNTAIKKIQFFINRAGKNLKNKKEILRAKNILMNKTQDLRKVAGFNHIESHNYSLEYDTRKNIAYIDDNELNLSLTLTYKEYKSSNFLVINFNNDKITQFNNLNDAKKEMSNLKRSFKNHIIIINTITNEIIF